MNFLIATLSLLIIHACFSYIIRGFYHQKSPTLVKRSHLSLSADQPPLELSKENALIVIEEVRKELGTIFGYNVESRKVGITGNQCQFQSSKFVKPTHAALFIFTGEINFEEVDGPTLKVSLKGRFWHATDTVIIRVENFVRKRIPEVVSVELDRAKSNILDDNRLNTEGGKQLF